MNDSGRCLFCNTEPEFRGCRTRDEVKVCPKFNRPTVTPGRAAWNRIVRDVSLSAMNGLLQMAMALAPSETERTEIYLLLNKFYLHSLSEDANRDVDKVVDRDFEDDAKS